MFSSSPKSCSASDNFEKNSWGTYGIQPYQFEPRVETVTSVEAREDEHTEIEEEERNTRLKIQTGR